MSEREQLLGQTTFYDAVRDVSFQNSMEIRLDLGRGEWEIKGVGARAGRTIAFEDPMFLRAMRLMIRIMQREARKAAPVRPLWKHRTTDPIETCPECGGAQLLEDPATGEEWPCPACGAG